MQIPETHQEIENNLKTHMNIGPFVNLLTDFGFKKVFGQEESKSSLIKFLNVLLFSNSDEKIQSIDFLPNEDVGEYIQERKVIFDLKCITNKKETIIVEMQKAKQEFFKDRAAYYGSKFVASQGVRGGWDFKLNKVYVVSILNFPLEGSKKVITKLNYLDVDVDNPDVKMDFCTFVFVELPRFKKKFVDCVNDLEQWLYIIKNLGILKDAPKSLQQQNEWFKFFELANIPKDSSNEYLKYMFELQIDAEFQSVQKVRDIEINDAKKELAVLKQQNVQAEKDKIQAEKDKIQAEKDKVQIKQHLDGLKVKVINSVNKRIARGDAIKDIAEDMELTEAEITTMQQK